MRKRILSILLTACMVMTLLPGVTPPAKAVYTPTIFMTLDGQPMSMSAIAANYTTLCAYNDSSTEFFDFEEYPKGTFTKSSKSDGSYNLWIYGTSGETSLSMALGSHYLVDQSPFTISKTTSYPLTLAFYSVTYNHGTYAENTGVGWTRIAAKDRGMYTWKPAPYIRNGYKQIGWSTDPSGTTKTCDTGAAIYPTSAMTLYPAWGALRAVTIVDGTGVSSTKTSATGSVTGSIASGSSAVEGETVTITPGTPATGYKLSAVKYNDGSDHVLTKTDGKYSFTMPAAAVTISAEYVQNTFAVTYNPGTNGTGSQQTDTKTGGIALTLKGAIFTRAGYDQTGWANADSGTKAYELGGSYTTDAAKNLYPVWTAKTYGISYALNDGTASGNPDSYTIESNAITLSNPTRTDFTFVGWTGSNGETAQTSVTIASGSTGDKSYTANWKANTPSAPLESIVTERTDKSITIAAANGFDYRLDLDGTDWISGTGASHTFTGLTAGHTYNLLCRISAVSTVGSASAASDASAALPVSTKNGPPSIPTAWILSVTANSVSMSPVTGGEYSKDGGSHWQVSNEFNGLNAATKYYFAVRIKETSDTVASASSAVITLYTAAATPAAGVGYTINYSAETIGITGGYEVSSDSSFAGDKLLSNGESIIPGATYYVRKAADTTTTPNTPASAYLSFTVAARPTEPTSSAYSYDYENEKLIFASEYEVFTATTGGSPVTSAGTVITPGGTLYIRTKATSSAPVSDWTTITIPARPATTGLSITAVRTDKKITVTAIDGAEYSKDGGTTWQDSNVFNGLDENTDYGINIRYAATASNFASSPLGSVTLKTKTEPGAAPSLPSISAQTYDSITIETILGYQYAITTSSTAPTSWDAAETANGTKTFSGLSSAAKYYIWVRAAETDTAMPSNSISISAYTAAAAPAAGVGYTINYSAETIGITGGYEVSSDSSFAGDKLLSNGAVITPGATYYVRKAADTTTTPHTPASEYLSFTVAARPTEPTSSAYSYDYENEKLIFASEYEVFTATTGGSPVTSAGTAITPGGTLYIRTKATSSAPVSDWTTITIPARPATTGLSITAVRTDKKITVTAIDGAEYRKDGGEWQSSNEFTGLSENTDHNISIRYAATDTNFASSPLNAVIKTKKSPGAAPGLPSVSAQTYDSITIDTILGYQYAITADSTAPTSWDAAETANGTKTFSGLSSATKYYIWVRAAETDTAMPSNSISKSAYTAAATPVVGVGYTINYSAETIAFAGDTYEVNTKSDFTGTEVLSGSSIAAFIAGSGTEAQSLFIRVKAIPSGAPASAGAAVSIPARPATPAAVGLNETIFNKNDGKITGVTTAMEWKSSGEAYAPVTAEQALNGITGLSDASYYVRYAAVTSGSVAFSSDEQEIIISAGYAITVTFESQGGSTVSQITPKSYGDKITETVEAPTFSGYNFAGWYKDPACSEIWSFAIDTLTDNITLYAMWSAVPTYTVTGTIVDDASPAAVVAGANVKIIQGTIQFGTTGLTDAYGNFSINNVPAGSYNLVITKGTRTAIIKISVSSGNVAVGNAVLPSGNANSILVINGSDTPDVVVGGLNTEANTQLGANASVEITMTVEKKDASTAANGTEVSASVEGAGQYVGMILDINHNMSVNGGPSTTLKETSNLIEIIIPIPTELQKKSTYKIYRYHNNVIDTITEKANADGEKIVIDRENWTLTLYAKKFSTYAIGYTNPSSSTIYDITALAGEGGSISPSSARVPAHLNQTFTITANEGHSISDVLVDGVSVGAVSSYTFSNVKSAHTIKALFKPTETAGLPYYVKDGKTIFIGFASDASGVMKYIAPSGVTVLFKDNPKNFTDTSGHWAKSYIDFVTKRELFVGTGGSEFSPQSGMTRAMFATVIGRLYERSYGMIQSKSSHSFKDVDYEAYYGVYVDWAAENNIITGVGGGLFETDREITRQEMATILYRFAKFLNALPDNSSNTVLKYPDSADIASWAKEAAALCQQTGIITGRDGGNFVPKGTATRAEVAAILQRFIVATVK